MKGILLLSHGTLCERVINSLQMLGMDTTKVEAVVLYADSDLEEYTKRLSDTIDSLDDGDGVLVITDLLSGTPFNREAAFPWSAPDQRSFWLFPHIPCRPESIPADYLCVQIFYLPDEFCFLTFPGALFIQCHADR